MRFTVFCCHCMRLRNDSMCFCCWCLCVVLKDIVLRCKQLTVSWFWTLCFMYSNIQYTEVFVYATADEAHAYMFYICFFCFLFFFAFSVRHKNTRQPFSGTAERIFMKLLPNDSGENVVCIAVPKLGPLINFWGLKTWWWRLASDWELVCWLWHGTGDAASRITQKN